MTERGPILKHWGLEHAEATLIAARENRVYRVETPSGPAALRLHRSGYRSEAELTSELVWMDMMAHEGLHLPRPIALPDGSHVVGGTQLADMLEWVEGQVLGDYCGLRVDDAKEAYRLLGREMARLHAACDSWTPPQGFSRPAWDREGLVGEAPLWGRFWENPWLTSDQAAIASGDENTAMQIMARGSAVLASRLWAEGRFDGVVILGGSMVTDLALDLCSALPLGVPKYIVSTVAFSTLIPAERLPADIQMILWAGGLYGLNSVCKSSLSQAAGAVLGATRAVEPPDRSKPLIGMTSLGKSALSEDLQTEFSP